MKRSDYATAVTLGSHVAYTRKHSHVPAAEGRAVFDSEGRPCIQVIVPIELGRVKVVVDGATRVANHLVHARGDIDRAAQGLDMEYAEVHLCPLVKDILAQYPEDEEPEIPTAVSESSVTCPSCLKEIERVRQEDYTD